MGWQAVKLKFATHPPRALAFQGALPPHPGNSTATPTASPVLLWPLWAPPLFELTSSRIAHSAHWRSCNSPATRPATSQQPIRDWRADAQQPHCNRSATRRAHAQPSSDAATSPTHQQTPAYLPTISSTPARLPLAPGPATLGRRHLPYTPADTCPPTPAWPPLTHRCTSHP